jgi:two-component system phosphate regulon sensor histidine kinase PhoR
VTLSRRLFAHTVVVAAILVGAARIVGIFDSWNAALFTLVLATAAAAIVAATSGARAGRGIRDLQTTARALAREDLGARPSLNLPGELGDLADAMHRLAEQLGARIDALRAEDALLGALIESLNEGVLAVDPRQQVVRINEAGRQLLRLRDAAVPISSDRLPRDVPLHQAIQGALTGRSVGPAEVTLGDRRVALTARPLTGGGAVIALYDLTQLRRLEQVRRDFVANVSHELRTPLTVVSGFAETLLDEDLTVQQRQEFAELIRTHTDRMQRIVDDLLDLSRIESGGWMPNPEALDTQALARETLSAVRAEAAGKKLELRVDVDAADTLIADRTAVRQILVNLLQNAVRHTSSGSVVVFTRSEHDGTWLGVRDTGSGIPAEHLPRIFERFYRVDPARARERGGTGLGLAIVKHLVDAHGGRLQADSEVGRGTTIQAFFPDRRPETQLQLDVV